MKIFLTIAAIILLSSGLYYTWQGTARVMATPVAEGDLNTLPLAARLTKLAELREAENAALATMPADPFGWTRLAEYARPTQGPIVAASFYDMARQTGRFEPGLLTPQALLALRLARVDDGIINTAFKFKSKELLPLVQQAGLVPRLELALADQPAQAARLQRMLKQ